MVVVVVLAMVGCSRQSDVEEVEPPRAFNCTGAIDVLDEPPEDWSSVLDVVAFPGDDVLQRGRSDEESGRRFSKFGLVIRADRSFVLSVAESSRPNALIGWGVGSDVPAASIEFAGCSGVCETDFQPNCPLGETGQWVVYPGGMWTVDAACIGLDVMVEDATVEVPIPIGVECG